MKPISNPFEIDENNCIVNPCKREYITGAWDQLVDEVVKLYRKYFPVTLHSIYIRGSVARGTTRNGVSDLDSFAVLKPGIPAGKYLWLGSESNRLTSLYPFCVGVELIVNTYETALNRQRATAINIKTQSVCIYGEDLSVFLEPFHIGAEACVHAFFLESELNKVKQILENEDSHTEKQKWIAWIMKRLVRTGLELVMTRERVYTRDLYWSSYYFCKVYPQQSELMQSALRLCLKPDASVDVVRDVIYSLGDWMTDEIGLVYPT